MFAGFFAWMFAALFLLLMSPKRELDSDLAGVRIDQQQKMQPPHKSQAVV